MWVNWSGRIPYVGRKNMIPASSSRRTNVLRVILSQRAGASWYVYCPLWGCVRSTALHLSIPDLVQKLQDVLSRPIPPLAALIESMTGE